MISEQIGRDLVQKEHSRKIAKEVLTDIKHTHTTPSTAPTPSLRLQSSLRTFLFQDIMDLRSLPPISLPNLASSHLPSLGQCPLEYFLQQILGWARAKSQSQQLVESRSQNQTQHQPQHNRISAGSQDRLVSRSPLIITWANINLTNIKSLVYEHPMLIIVTSIVFKVYFQKYFFIL